MSDGTRTDLAWSESETVSYREDAKSAVVDRVQLVTLLAMEALFFNVRVLHALGPLEYLSDAGPCIYSPIQDFSKVS